MLYDSQNFFGSRSLIAMLHKLLNFGKSPKPTMLIIVNKTHFFAKKHHLLLKIMYYFISEYKIIINV